MGLGDSVALALGQLAETRGQALLNAVEVAGPFRQSLFDAALHEGQRLAELAGEAFLSLVHLASPLIGELALLFGKA